MVNAAAVAAERATSDLLNGPDWAINIELCNLINMKPGRTKYALKILKKKLEDKNSKIQLLALCVLESLSKNCGEIIFQQIIKRDILHKMVKIVKKMVPDLNVKEKILILIDTWQEATKGRFPKYSTAYNELKLVGVEFPRREANSVPLYTQPQTHPIVHAYEEAVVQASLESNASGLSLPKIHKADGNAEVLMEMLAPSDPNNPQGVKDEIIVDLVEQCRELNDKLQRVICMHADIVNGTQFVSSAVTSATPDAQPTNVNVNLSVDDESDNDLEELVICLFKCIFCGSC